MEDFYTNLLISTAGTLSCIAFLLATVNIIRKAEKASAFAFGIAVWVMLMTLSMQLSVIASKL